MKMKHLIASVAMFSMIGVGSANAFPDNRDLPKNHPPVNKNPVEQLSEADMDAWLRLHEKHAEKVEPIRNILTARRMELKALENNVKVTPDYIRDLTEEIVNLQTKIAKLDNAFFEESAVKFNIDLRPKHDGRHAVDGRGDRGDRGNCDKRDKRGNRDKDNRRAHQAPCPAMHGTMMPFVPCCPAMQGMIVPHHGMHNAHKGGNPYKHGGGEQGRMLPKNHPPVHMKAPVEAPVESPAEDAVQSPAE